jgi:hypothetical protein
VSVWDSPVRGVRVDCGTQTNCGGVAGALADFEPHPVFAFVRRFDRAVGTGDAELVDLCVRAFEDGVRGALAERTGGPLPPVRVVLRWILVHPVDSTEGRNREAGELAVARAIATAVRGDGAPGAC